MSTETNVDKSYIGYKELINKCGTSRHLCRLNELSVKRLLARELRDNNELTRFGGMNYRTSNDYVTY